MTTITQTITTLPTAPDPATMTPTEFSAAAAAYVLAQKAMVPELNTWAGQVNTVGGEVATNAATATTMASNASASADDADAAAAVAQGAAQYAGLYSSLTGSKTAGITAEYLGAIWLLLENSSDITLDVPGVSSKWARAYGGGVPYERASNIRLTAEDSGKFIDITSGTFSQTFDAGATLGEGWSISYRVSGTGVVTLDPDGAELINGSSTLVVERGYFTLIIWNGTGFDAYQFAEPVGHHEVVVNTGNGHGSTNTCIRRFTTAEVNTGTDITYADSGTLGGSFTINRDGVYAITYIDVYASGQMVMGVSLNSAALTTSIATISTATRIAYGAGSYAGNERAIATVTTRLSRGDVVRAHTDGASAVTNAVDTVFRICKVGV